MGNWVVMSSLRLYLVITHLVYCFRVAIEKVHIGVVIRIVTACNISKLKNWNEQMSAYIVLSLIKNINNKMKQFISFSNDSEPYNYNPEWECKTIG